MKPHKNAKLTSPLRRDGSHEHPVVAAAAGAALGGALAAAKVVRDRVAERRARSFALQPGEEPAEGIRRIARGQIDLAIDELQHAGNDVGAAIHETRKAGKRVRALVRLARDGLGDEVYRRENVAFRDLGRRLSPARDATVLVETLDAIRDRFADEVPDGAFARLRRTLADQAEEANERIRADEAMLGEVVAELAQARERVATWPISSQDGPHVLADGLERIYRRGRKALRAAVDGDGETATEQMHELRKRSKDLWHAAQVVEPLAPKRSRTLARRAHRIANALGEDHDLAVLLEYARDRADLLEPGERPLLAGMIHRRRARLQRRALDRARRVYGRKPRKLARRLATVSA